MTMLGRWPFFRLAWGPRLLLALTDAAAVLITAVSLLRLPLPLTGRDLAGVAWLAAGAMLSAESSRRAERFRERHRDGPHQSLTGMWFLPAAVLFPAGLTCLLIVAVYSWRWLRVIRHSPYQSAVLYPRVP